MLEPVMRPRTGRLLWFGVGLFTLLGVFSEDYVTTQHGAYPVTSVALAFAAVAVLRIIGLSMAIGRGATSMPFYMRAASWVAAAVPLVGLGLLSDVVGLSIFGILVALDAAGALLPSRHDDEEAPEPTDRWDAWRRRLTTPALVGLAVAAVILFHVAYASRVEGGLLLDWAFMTSIFGLALRYTSLPARRGRDDAAQPPKPIRRHERRARPIPDPTRDRVRAAADAFRATGDVGLLLEYVRDVGGDALVEEARTVLNRAGTSRADDLEALADLMDDHLMRAPARPPSRSRPPSPEVTPR